MEINTSTLKTDYQDGSWNKLRTQELFQPI